jgi:hypothetical protein
MFWVRASSCKLQAASFNFASIYVPNKYPRKLKELPQELSELPHELSELRDKVSELPNKVSVLPFKVSALPFKVSALPHKVSELPNELSELPHELGLRLVSCRELGNEVQFFGFLDSLCPSFSLQFQKKV